MPGSPSHLARRFFDVATSRPLTSTEQADVAAWLSPDLQTLFLAQDEVDQRHGYHAACTVAEAGFDQEEVVVAALMHDIGKRHARLGLVGRTVASLFILLHLPLTPRMRIYRDHGDVGADDLAAVEAPALAVDFARHHHGERPTTIPGPVWDVLELADQPPKTPATPGRRITSEG